VSDGRLQLDAGRRHRAALKDDPAALQEDHLRNIGSHTSDSPTPSKTAAARTGHWLERRLWTRLDPPDDPFTSSRGIGPRVEFEPGTEMRYSNTECDACYASPRLGDMAPKDFARCSVTA